MYDTILIPFDGTEEARKGANEGIGLAASLEATVHALYVVDLPGAPRTIYLRDDEEEIREEYHEYGENVTAEACEMAADKGVECTAAIKTGNPAEEIVEYAKENGMDAIVLGTAYKGTLRGLLGGTTDKVVRTSPIPVLTHRMQVDE